MVLLAGSAALGKTGFIPLDAECFLLGEFIEVE